MIFQHVKTLTGLISLTDTDIALSCGANVLAEEFNVEGYVSILADILNDHTRKKHLTAIFR
jgi:hypothetical protein